MNTPNEVALENIKYPLGCIKSDVVASAGLNLLLNKGNV